MALLWLDGFEDKSLWSRKYGVQEGSGGGVLCVASRPNSGNCAEIHGASGTEGYIQRVLPPAEEAAEVVFGAALNINSLTSQRILGYIHNNAGSIIATMYVTSAGGIEVNHTGSAGSFLTAPGGSVVAGSWFYFELRYLPHLTNGSAELRINGVTLGTASAEKTANASLPVRTIRFSAPSSTGVDWLLDDFYICNTLGTDYNDFLGDIRVETIRPNGNGNANQFTGSDGNSVDNYLLVDEAAYSSADYVGSDTAGHNDQYAFGNLARTTGSVRGVMVTGVVSKDDSGAKDARLLARTGAVDYNGSNFSPSTSDVVYKQVWEVNPGTTADWSISEVNAAEFGIEVV